MRRRIRPSQKPGNIHDTCPICSANCIFRRTPSALQSGAARKLGSKSDLANETFKLRVNYFIRGDPYNVTCQESTIERVPKGIRYVPYF